MKQAVLANASAVPAKSLKSAIRFLRKLDVPASRIAAALGESSDNIRHLDSRSYATEQVIPIATPVEGLAQVYLAEPEHWSALRQRQMPEIYGQGRQRLEALAEEISKITKRCQNDLPQGFAALKKLLPYVASAKRIEALRVKSLLEENLGWFAAHQGLSHSAYVYARSAMNHRKECYEESLGDKSHLIAYASSALIASNALLLSHKPAEAMATLNLAYQAKQAAGEPLGSEWYRQLATALLQHQGYDRLTTQLFDKSGEEMQRRREYSHPVSIRMNREQRQALLVPSKGFDTALELVSEAEAAFGRFSLQHIMTINWAAAVALRLDCVRVKTRALESLQSIMSRDLPFEHQKTVSKLLFLTPSLHLRPQALNTWLRFALYENSARSK